MHWVLVTRGGCLDTEASPEFEDLVSRLLDKNPATRIGWAELPRHMFWNTPLPARDMPPEPLLERFIEENGLLPAPINDPLAEEVHILAYILLI